MRDILTIIITERRTLLKGLIFSFLLTLPFTFLPAVINNGLSLSTITGRFNESVIYSVGFSLIVVIAAIIHNYTGLVDRKWYFDKPAFKSLDFYGRIDGLGSIVHNLETLLLGKISLYYFRLNLVITDNKEALLEIIPLIDLTDKANEIEKLERDHGFTTDFFFGKRIQLSEIDLEDPDGVRKILIKLSKVLENLGFESLEVDQSELEN